MKIMLDIKLVQVGYMIMASWKLIWEYDSEDDSHKENM